MFSFFYNLFIQLYFLAIKLFSMVDSKAKKWIDGRKNLFEVIEHELKQRSAKRIWIHVASLGEFEQSLPLKKKLLETNKNFEIITTFFSPSGYEIAKKTYPDELFFYLPLDTKKNAKRFIELVNPTLVFFIKYEFWKHFLTALKDNQIPVFLVSGIFRKNQLFFKKYGGGFRDMLSCFSAFFIQNNESISLLKSIGYENSILTGDTRYERVLELKNLPFNDEKIESFIASKKVFVAGSVWESDIEFLKKIILKLPSNFVCILAPHDIEKFDKNLLNFTSFSTYSNFDNSSSKILILDTIGMLSKIYRTATFAYVGGGFGKGIHNILEAAIYNIPVLIGPKHEKFFEAKELLTKKLVFEIKNNGEEFDILPFLEKREPFIVKSMSFFDQKTNASQKIIVYLIENNFL
ncbi:MAG: 3-deoxy-D-manno-octulosonic acid transferase [Chitinophagaceae bacterium]|nr:3-deoxy-D-manno-octulosonic acid transferase [Chitinophagaceae bacterium]